MNTATIIRPAPAVVIPNGLTWKPYVYRGRGYDVLTPHLGDPFEDPYEDEAPRAGRRAAAPCGTTAAYARHVRHGEKPCEPCADAERDRRFERAQTALHRDLGNGSPRCGATAKRELRMAKPGEDVTCSRCIQPWRLT